MDDPDIFEAMHLMYGPILDAWSGNAEIDPTGLLLFVLASVFYHSEWVQSQVTKQPGYPFSLIPFLNHPGLLNELKLKVSLDPVGQVKRVTGIPPHIENTCLCAKMLRLCEETLLTVRDLTIQVKSEVKGFIDCQLNLNRQLSNCHQCLT